MRFLLLLWVMQGLLLSGCRKKTSPEFYKLESAQSVLVARDGDDAWVSPEMATILEGVQAIPEDTLEKPRATALAAKISAEQARVTAERVKPPRPPPVDPFAGRVPSIVAGAREPVAAPPEPESAGEDAGAQPSVPWPGMDEKVFVARFGECFAQGPNATLPDGQPANAYVLKENADCQKRYGAPNVAVSYLFTARGLWGKAVESTRLIDGGTIQLPVPPQPKPPEPPPPIITTPGAPLPDGYEKTPITPEAERPH